MINHYTMVDRCHATSRFRFSFSNFENGNQKHKVAYTVADRYHGRQVPGLGLGNGKQKLENGNRKREVAWHLSATV